MIDLKRGVKDWSAFLPGGGQFKRFVHDAKELGCQLKNSSKS
jgi:hypothetical protein